MDAKRDPLIEDKLPFYAMGTLSAAEMQEVEAYVKAFPEVKAELDEMLAAAEMLPYSVAEIEPPAFVKSALLEHARANPRRKVVAGSAVREQPKAAPPTSGFWERLLAEWQRLASSPAVPVAAALGLLLIAFLAFRLVNLSGELNLLREENAQLHEINQELLLEAESQTDLINFAADAQTQRLTLAGTEFQPGATGSLYVRPTDETSLLVLSGLQPLAADQTYQLWLIEEQPISAGLVEIREGGRGVFEIAASPSLNDVTAIGLSVEPQGGSDQPTGDIVMYSEVD